MAFVSLDRSTSTDCAQGNIQALTCGPESARDRLACGDSDCGPSHGPSAPDCLLLPSHGLHGNNQISGEAQDVFWKLEECKVRFADDS